MGIKNRRPPPGNVRRFTVKGNNCRGVITSKTGRSVQFESVAAEGLIMRLDRDPAVRDYNSYPRVFKYNDHHGKSRTYTPELIVWHQNGNVEIHGINGSEQPRSLELQHRYEIIHSLCQSLGWYYVTHDRNRLPKDGELANLRFLFLKRPLVYASRDVARATDLLLPFGEKHSLSAVIIQVAHMLGSPEPTVMAALCHMLWYGEIITDLHELIFVNGAISANAKIWRATE